MRFNAEKFLNEAGIAYRDRGINVPKNAVNIRCIYCGEQRYHLVVYNKRKYAKCWVCHKRVSTVQLVKDVAKCSWEEAKQLVYGERHLLFTYEEDIKQEAIKVLRAEVCRLPKGTAPIITTEKRKPSKIRENAKLYMFYRRDISAQRVEGYDLHYGYGGEQEYRIVIPMYFGGELVNYTGRDFTGKSGLRYKDCKVENCVLLPTEFLYGLDEFEGKRAIIVEGAIDRIKLGRNDTLAINTKYLSGRQKTMISNLDLRELIFVLDPDAYRDAEELAEYFRPVVDKVKAVKLDGGDPAKVGRWGVERAIEEVKWFDF